MVKPLQSITATSASRKPLYIGLIVAALVIVLVLVYFGTKQFAGQAGSTGGTSRTTLTVGQGGITGTTPVLGTITVDIGANIGTAQSVAFDFILNYPADALEYVDVTRIVSWGSDAFERKTPGRGQIAYELATIDYTSAITGTSPLAKVTFNVRRPLTPADYQALTFSSFHVYNLENEANLVLSTVEGSGITVIEDQCTVEQCRTENDMILRGECPAGTTVDGTSCTAYFNDASRSEEKDTLCGAWLDTLGADDITAMQRNVLCGAGATQGFNADLNGDGLINDGDIIIIQLAMLAKESRYSTCGGTGQQSCQFPRVYVCENLESSYTEDITSCG